MNTKTNTQETSNFRLETTKKVKPIKKGDLLTIQGREWFDRINGNSYHCVYIFVNGSLVITVPFNYGYGDSYIQSATEALSEAAYLLNPLSIISDKYYSEHS